MRHPLYLLYATLLFGTYGQAIYRGSTLFPANINQVKNVPKTVRDNPGSYRSHYGFYPHYIGGK